MTLHCAASLAGFAGIADFEQPALPVAAHRLAMPVVYQHHHAHDRRVRRSHPHRSRKGLYRSLHLRRRRDHTRFRRRGRPAFGGAAQSTNGATREVRLELISTAPKLGATIASGSPARTRGSARGRLGAWKGRGHLTQQGSGSIGRRSRNVCVLPSRIGWAALSSLRRPSLPASPLGLLRGSGPPTGAGSSPKLRVPSPTR